MPEEKTCLGLCEGASLVDLLLAFPSGGGQSGGQTSAAKRDGCIGGLTETELETLEASGTALGLVLKAMDIVEPSVVIVGSLDPL